MRRLAVLLALLVLAGCASAPMEKTFGWKAR
jgi:hypothetical protein